MIRILVVKTERTKRLIIQRLDEAGFGGVALLMTVGTYTLPLAGRGMDRELTVVFMCQSPLTALSRDVLRVRLPEQVRISTVGMASTSPTRLSSRDCKERQSSGSTTSSTSLRCPLRRRLHRRASLVGDEQACVDVCHSWLLCRDGVARAGQEERGVGKCVCVTHPKGRKQMSLQVICKLH